MFKTAFYYVLSLGDKETVEWWLLTVDFDNLREITSMPELSGGLVIRTKRNLWSNHKSAARGLEYNTHCLASIFEFPLQSAESILLQSCDPTMR